MIGKLAIPVYSIVLYACLSVSAVLADQSTKANDAKRAFNAAIQSGEFDQATKFAEAFVAKYPDNKTFDEDIFKGSQTTTSKMKLEYSAKLHRLLLETFPESKHASHARSELVACYTHLRELDACIAQAKKNLKTEPNSEWAEYWEFLIGQSQFRLWKFDVAKTNLDAFLVKYPKGEYAKHARKCLSFIDPPWEMNAHGIVKYSGKFDGDIRVKAALKKLPEEMKRGYKILEKRLGLDLRKDTNIIYAFVDAENKCTGGLKAQTRVIGIKNKPTVYIKFFTEFVVSNPVSYQYTIVHEMKHAGFQGVMGHPYDSLPQWIREGLAVYGSDDVDTRVRLVLCNEIVAGRNPKAVLGGTRGPRQVYLEGSLAFEWLEEQSAGNVKKFCQRLVKGESYKKIWANLSGMAYKEAIAATDAYCERRVDTALGKPYKTFVELRKEHLASMKRKPADTKTWLEQGGGKAATETWLTENPTHPAAPFARFCLARSLIQAGDHEPGRKLLKQILAEDGMTCTLLDDAQYWIGVSYNRQKDVPNYLTAFGVLLRDFSNCSAAIQLIGKLPAAGPVTE